MGENIKEFLTIKGINFYSKVSEKILARNPIKIALSAVQKHINYYSTLGKGNLVGLQEIVNQMRH